MTIDVKLVALIGGLFGGRLFPDSAPIDTPRPYGIYQKIGGRSINYTSNDIPDAQHSVIQINTWHDSRIAASELAMQVEDTLRQASTMTAQPESEPISLHEPDLKRYGASQDFSIWSTR